MQRALLFTPEELEEMRRADAEIEAEFRMDRETIAAKRREAIAAYQREYYEANREAIAAYKREYYEANRESIAAKRREYREAKRREAIAAYQREYYEANRESIAAKKEKVLKRFRLSGRMTQRELGRILGVTQSLISKWESGESPINMGILEKELPELAEEVRKSE